MNRKKSSKSPPILIVDDDKNFLNTMEFFLRSKGLTNVECCRDSREVMALLEKEKYSLVLLDLAMPNISGQELLPQIVEKFPRIPVIILTGLSEVEAVVECMQYGAIDYLVKPVDQSRLLETIRDSLDFIDLEKTDVLKKFDFSDGKYAPSHSIALLKIDFLLRTGKAQLVIAKFAPVIENKKIDKANVNLFFIMGKAYEKTEDFITAEGIYRAVKQFDPGYPGIKEKLERIEKLKEDIIKNFNKDRYDKIETIGKGGIGVVYKAKDKIPRRMVALKILNESAIKDQRDIERFVSEARKAAKLEHPNIVNVYSFGQIEKNDYFISMEFIEGINLFDLINKNHPIVIEVIVLIARKLFEALEYSHRKGIIHRDIKPVNIMITYEKKVKVVDFGIAVLINDLKRDEKDVMLGSPYYMSPEQIQHSETDHRTDIYSAGVTLFHLVTGKPPYMDTSIEKITRKHLDEPVPPIKEYRDDIPEELIQIIEKCMEKNKEDRYQSAGQVIEEINGIRDGSGNAITTEQSKSKFSETISFDDTKIVMRWAKKYLQFLQSADMTEEERKDLQENWDIGGDTVIEALNKALKDPDEQSAKAALDGLKNLGELDRYFAEIIDKIDILTFAYHLVYCGYASTDLLIELNPVEIRKAIQNIFPEKKGVELLFTALQIFEEKYSHLKPDSLWYSGTTTNLGERIKKVKKMFSEMIKQ